MSPPDLSMLRSACAIAREAGQLVMEGYRAAGSVRKKGSIDLVTDYDLRSEELICTRLNERFPDHAIVAEEAQQQQERDFTWYVDPIDGTTNFAHGHPFFSISLGLYYRGQPALGVVLAPALGGLWTALSGQGARRNDEPCRVSETADLRDALCATGFPYDRASSPENNFREYTVFKRRVQGVRRCGSASIDLCLVADGTYDLYWEQKLKPWDMAAAAILVLEAGGRLSGYEGQAADPRDGKLVASNGLLHDQTLQVLAEARAMPPL